MDEIYLVHDQEIKWSKAKVRVYADSVLCLRKLSDLSEANRRRECQVADFQMSAPCGELLGIHGEAIEFEEKIFPGFTSLQILQEIQNDLQSGTLNLRYHRSNYLHVNVQLH